MKRFLSIFSILMLILLNTMISIFIPVTAHSSEFKLTNILLSASNSNVNINPKKINYSNDYIEVDINIPMLNGLKDKDIEDKINTNILNHICKLKNETEGFAKADIENRSLFNPYTIQTNYDVHYTSPSFLSLTIMYYQYTGGAHGISYKIPYNLNLITGENITLEKLFKPNTNYIYLVNKEIQIEIDKRNAAVGAIPITLFKTISNNQPFYIDGNNLVIYFQPYEIGPYVLGIQEFKIPLNKLNNLQKSLI